MIDNFKNDSSSVIIKTKNHNGISGTLVSISNGGHPWPDKDSFNIGFPLGLTTQEIDVNEIMWKFFSCHTNQKEN